MRRVLLFPVPLLLFLLTAATCSATPAAPCRKKCGGVSIPYPFGIGKGCFLDGFEIQCVKTGSGVYKPYAGNVEVTNISLGEAQITVLNLIGFSCYDNAGYPVNNQTSHTYLRLYNTPYRFSNTRNKFTAIGCRTLAYINDFSTENPYMSGCLSVCQKNSSFTDGAPCTGRGCCQTSIPKGLDSYEVAFETGINHGPVTDFSPCSYAFLADNEWYKFNSSDVVFHKIYKRTSGYAPIVLDWAIHNDTSKNSSPYACVSSHSRVDSTDDSGYTCSCSSGYQGNPYIPNGCKDIDECQHPEQNGCYGKCTNWPPGSFNCSCPSGSDGDPYKQGGCRPMDQCQQRRCYGTCNSAEGNFNCSCPPGMHGDPTRKGGCKQNLSLLFKILLAGLCTFLVAAVMYLVYEKAKLIRAKQACFRKNGGLLLQQQINAHQCLRFKIFTEEEMRRATNNFHKDRIKGRGGQGIVYEGILDDKTVVAIKKATMIDEKKKADFASEMYILSLINHKNVIKILGCCLEVEVPMLVYEFLSHGTLSQHIQNKNRSMPLSFRLKIAVDCASALAYLHSYASPSIVHRDVKSSNILLDDEYTAKISDFGASLLPVTDLNESGLPGTYGYFDPESFQTGELTEKSDVYSFAVVILELLTRKTALYSVYTEGSREIKSLAQTFKEKGLADIIDTEIRHQVTKEQIDEFAKLLGDCLREKGKERPPMTQVVAWLRRMREFNQNLSDDQRRTEDIEPVHFESSNHTTFAAEYYSSGYQTAFELDCRVLE